MPLPDPTIRKQAVIVIHGIGEQRPMATMRNLVGTLVGSRQMSRPDRMGQLLELRRVRVGREGAGEGAAGQAPVAEAPASSSDPRAQPAAPAADSSSDSGAGTTVATPAFLSTDFYELYWAYMIRDTQWTSVAMWLGRLFRQRVRGHHAQRRRLWLFKAAAVLAVGGLLVLGLQAAVHRAGLLALLSQGLAWLTGISPLAAMAVKLLSLPALILFLGRYLVQSFFVDVLGDAARYLSPEPENVEARQNVLAAGMALLDRLHQDRNIDRIVVVGHSLGSIIGYDLLSTYWAAQHPAIWVPADTVKGITCAGDALAAADPRRRPPVSGSVAPAPARPPQTWDNGAYLRAFEAFQAAQDRAWKDCIAFYHKPRKEAPHPLADQRPARQRWLVTDFVTFGSPLCYFDYLRRSDRSEHERAISRGELATCPPEPLPDEDERAQQAAPNYGFKNFGDKRFRFNPAAPFALTRWTNLYYPGDLFSGPLRDLFGIGIRDIPLRPGRKERRLLWPYLPGAHVRYWQTADGKTPLAMSRHWLGQAIFGAGWRPPEGKEAPLRPRNLRAGAHEDERRD